MDSSLARRPGTTEVDRVASITKPGQSERRLVAVDLFCGAGGLSLAFHQAGFFIAAAVEKDENAAATYKQSFCSPRSRGTLLLCEDVRSDKVRKALEELQTKTPVDIVLGGPPCQDFSPARLKKRRNGQRSSLVKHYFKLLAVMQPKAFLFENVPGLRTVKKGAYWNAVVSEAKKLGYRVFSGELDASCFGVPQRRRRLFVVGLKSDLGAFEFPKGDESKPPTVWQTIKHLRKLKAGEEDPNDPMHRSRNHRPWFVDFLKHIKAGQDWRDVKHIRILDCHKNHNGHYDVYGRMRRHEVAPTITGGCTNPSKGRFIHPTQHRGLTVREAALLQTFPERWKFVGGMDSLAQQVGNAVPVKLGAALASVLKEVLERATSSSQEASQSQRRRVRVGARSRGVTL